MNYAEAEEYINQIPRFSKVKSEENVDEILALFGHPEKKFAYIHVTSTKRSSVWRKNPVVWPARSSVHPVCLQILNL